MILTFLLAVVVLCALMALAWALAQRTGQSGWVDVVWSFSLGIAGVLVALLPWDGGPSGRQITVAVLVAAWSLRLWRLLPRAACRCWRPGPHSLEASPSRQPL